MGRPPHAAVTLDDWELERGEPVDVIDWTNVPVGGAPFRGTGTFLGSENAVARVRLDDGTVRGFNRGDVTKRGRRGRRALEDLRGDSRQYVDAYLTTDPFAHLIGWHRRRPVVRGTLSGLPGEIASADAIRHDTVLAAGGGLLDLSENMRDSDAFTALERAKTS